MDFILYFVKGNHLHFFYHNLYFKCDKNIFPFTRLFQVYLHKQLPLNDEELSCRHSAETLVDSDEEEGAHPVRDRNEPKLSKYSFLFYGTLYLIIQTNS